MRTLSSKGIVHPGKTVSVQKFNPPAQNYTKPQKGGTQTGASAEGAASGRNSRNWTPVTQEEAVCQEGARFLDGAREEARQIMVKSNQMAENILKEAREEAERIKKEAAIDGCQSGYEDGFKEGVDKAVEEHGKVMEAQLEEFRQDMEKALADVDEAKEQCLRIHQKELLDCAVAVAEKVIHISLKSSGEVIKRMIIAETEKLRKTAWVKIYMEKADYEMMMKADSDVVSELSRLSDNIKFIVMDKENSGNCIIEMPEEIIDISVDTQLENIKEILQNIMI